MTAPEKKPLPRRAHLITPEGAQHLANELEFLWRKRTPGGDGAGV